MNEELATFLSLLDQYDWFCDAEIDNFGRFVVYVDKMDISFIGSTPDIIGGCHVLFHFASSQFSNKNSEPIKNYNSINNIYRDYVLTNFSDFEENYMNLSLLTNELESLEKICGIEILGHLFYEIHDDINAVTNYSNDYPEVRQKMEKLYQTYGFDVLYEQLEL